MADRSSSRKPLVLVVDDDGAHRLMLLTLLDQWGYRAIDRDDGLKALEFIRETPVDLVLTDVRMPNLDGIELPPEGADLEGMLASVERKLLEEALKRSGGTKKEAARLLGISFRSIRYRIQKHGLE